MKPNPFTRIALVVLVVSTPAQLFAGGSRVVHCPPGRVFYSAPSCRVVAPPKVVVAPKPPPPKTIIEKTVVEKTTPVEANANVTLQIHTKEEDPKPEYPLAMPGLGDQWERLKNAMEYMDRVEELGAKVTKYKNLEPEPEPQAAPPPTQYFGNNAAAAYPFANTQYATFQQQFQPRYHEILDRGVRESANSISLTTGVIDQALRGARELSELELAVARAEVEVKKINAQAHLLAASRGFQSMSTFGSETLSTVQQGGQGLQGGSVSPQGGVYPQTLGSGAPAPNYGPALGTAQVGGRDGNNCATCHSATGAGRTDASLAGFDVDRLTLESAQRAIQAMANGSMPKGQPAYSAAEQAATVSQLEAALGGLIK